MVGFCMGGDKNKVIKVSKRHQDRIAKIFQDSDESADEEPSSHGKTEQLLSKLDNF